MGKEPLTQIQEAQKGPYKINPRKNTPRHINQTDQIKDTEKISKAAREKKQICYLGILINICLNYKSRLGNDNVKFKVLGF